ncbi:MAG: ADOP family duplicated permease [Terriglobia bacterium]
MSIWNWMSRRTRREEELDEEVQAHLRMAAQERMEQGESPEHARTSAVREFGNVTLVKEVTRDMWGLRWFETLLQDLRFGLRMLRKKPGFAAVAVITIALGIGANTAIFSLIDAVMLRPLPVPRPQQLVVFKWDARQWPETNSYAAYSSCPIKATGLKNPIPAGCSFSYPVFEQMQAQKSIFAAAFAFVPASQLGVSIDGKASFAEGEFVSGDFFPALGIRAASGRMLGVSDEGATASPAAVLSYSYWKRQFGGAPSAIGKSIVVNGIPTTIVGVAPPAFLGLDPGIVQDMWLPLSAQNVRANHWPDATDAAGWWLMVGARLKPQVTIPQAEAAAQVIFTRGVTSGGSPLLKQEDAPHLELVSAAHGLATLRKNFGDALFLLMAAVGLVLLIACANVASLTLARTAAREKEFAMRFALGAERWRIIRQLLTESLIMAAAGGLLGIVLAYLGASSLAAFLSSNWYSLLEINVHPDWRVLGFTMAIATLTGILFGLAPALRSTRIRVGPALKESAVSPHGAALMGRRFGVGNVLVVAQVALSILVLVGASLLARTLINLATMNVGFDAHNVVLFSVQPELNGYQGARLAGLFPELQRRLSAVPGVTSVGYSGVPLLSGAYGTQDIFLANETDQSPQVNVLSVGPNFFETMRIPLLAGRTYNSHDFEYASERKANVVVVKQTSARRFSVIVNHAFAQRFFGKHNPVGQLIGLAKGKPPSVEIVGVVQDTKYYSLREGIEPTIYFPMQPGGGTFEVRTASDPKTLLPSIRDAVRRVDSNLPIFQAMTQTEQIDRAIFQERLAAWLSGAFAVLALVVACIGLYGLLAHEVAGRTHEVGVRMALGASPAEVLALVLRRGIRVVAIGVVIGIGTALGLARYLQSLLYGVRPVDPLAYATVTILLVLVTFGACYLPARRATKVDPMVALRYE